MSQRPRSVVLVLAFILINALVWLGFGVIVALNLHPALPDQPWLKAMMAILSIAIAGILGLLYFLIRKPNRIAYYLLLAGFTLSLLITIFDDFGWSDLAIALLNLVPLVLLIHDRAWYLQRLPSPEASPSA